MAFIKAGWSSEVETIGFIYIVALTCHAIFSFAIYFTVLNTIVKTRKLFELCKTADQLNDASVGIFRQLALDNDLDINFRVDFFYRTRNQQASDNTEAVMPQRSAAHNDCVMTMTFADENVYKLTPLEVLCKCSSSERLQDFAKILFNRQDSSKIHLAKALWILCNSSNPCAPKVIQLFINHIFNKDFDFNQTDQFLLNRNGLSSSHPLIRFMLTLFHAFPFLTLGEIGLNQVYHYQINQI